MVDQVKCGTDVLASHNSVEENTKNTCKSSSTMNNAEIQLDNIGPKQSPIGKRKSDNSKESPVQITRPRSELGKNMDEQRTKLGVSSDGIKKSPAQIKKTRSLTSQKAVGDQTSVRNEICSVQLRKVKSDSAKALYDSKRELRRKVIKEEMKEFDDKKVVDESIKDVGDSISGTEESPTGIKKSRSNQDFKELKANTNNASNEVEIQIMTAPPSVEHKEIEGDLEKKDLDSINIVLEEKKPKKLVIKENKSLPRNERSAPIAKNHAKIHPKPASDNFHGPPSKLQSFAALIMWRDVSRSAFVFGIGAFSIISSSYTKDLNISFISVLSYLALVYLGVSFIFRSLISRRSNDMDKRHEEYVVGEEEAVWVVKLILPYVNESLLNLRRLFSGDPPTTMKLAVLLFILARYGGSITIWKMTKLGFFGVFVVPKLCSSYSIHIAAYGTFWIRRFGDAWETCSNKKAVGFGIFALVWNLSSVVTRIWAVFLLFVAFKYYQQFCLKEEERVHEEEEEEAIAAKSSSHCTGGQQVLGRKSTVTVTDIEQTKTGHVLE